MKDPKRKQIDYLRIFAQKLQNVPAYRDFAQACNDILKIEVDDKRKKLEKLRDSVKYRRGDVLYNVKYEPEVDKPAVLILENKIAELPDNFIIPEATVKNAINNITYYEHSNSTDYLDLAFTYNNKSHRWLKPINLVQERAILQNNSYIMGFDFFNTKLNDEDLQRLYNNIQLYWEESGTDDNFMNFIGFIKNTRFDLVALWTETIDENEDPDTEYPYLEPYDPTSMRSVKDGGINWQTSHVEIQYDLAQFRKYYIVNLDDLEQLFYYFAPIILVLERVTGTFKVETPVYGSTAVELTRFDYDILKPTTRIETNILGISTISITNFEYGIKNTKNKGCLGLDSPIDLTQNCFDFMPYLLATGIV